MKSLHVDKRQLKELVRVCEHHNVAPMLLKAHERGFPDDPVSTLLSKMVADVSRQLSDMTDAEVESAVSELPGQLRFFLDSRDSNAWGATYLEDVAYYHVVDLLLRSQFPLSRAIDQRRITGIAYETYPELAELTDAEGLLSPSSDFIPVELGFLYRDHLIYYHQLFRRGYRSNPNFDFLNRLFGYVGAVDSSVALRIAIDTHRLMPREFYRHIGEKAFWYGPRFDQAAIDGPGEVGLTVMKRTEPELFDLSNQLERTEFFWSYRDGIKTLEVEEISVPSYEFDQFNLNRYVHLERDIDARAVRHLDGSVKAYLSREYRDRCEARIPNEPRAHRKVKLFRLDGSIDDRVWPELVGLFFRYNEMVLEYFDPERYEELFGEDIRRIREAHGACDVGELR